MKVLHLNKTDIKSGAAKAAYRLHTGLNRIGIDSSMIVDNKFSGEKEIFGFESFWNKAYEKIRKKIDSLQLLFYDKENVPFSPGFFGRRISKESRIEEFDVVNIHWINDGFLSIKEISRIKKPLVWTFHDRWAFTGGCHTPFECEKYKTHCRKCPQLNSDSSKDLSYKIFEKKLKAFADLDLNIVTPSTWMKDCVEKSKLLKDENVCLIPNGLDTEVFKPVESKTARNILGVPADRKVISFGAIDVMNKKGKGSEFLLKALKTTNLDNLYLLVFGASYSSKIEKLQIESKFMGTLNDEYSMNLVYNASDVFVGPSLEDNLPNTIMESLSCGTPVTAFNTGGIPDMIDNKSNGYLAELRDSEDLARGIEWCIENRERNRELGRNGREKVLNEYTMDIQAKRYKKLYEEII